MYIPLICFILERVAEASQKYLLSRHFTTLPTLYQNDLGILRTVSPSPSDRSPSDVSVLLILVL
jgi:hypothetical protein